MSASKPIFTVILLIVCAGASVGAGAQTATKAAPPILPQSFAGWQMQGAAATSTNPVSADSANAAILKEFGFTDWASSAYKRDDGRTLKIRAARFGDASGAFGAYTFYLQPNMSREQVGDQGASLNQRVLFYRGHILVDAVFDKPSVMSAAELRELSGVLPRPGGNAGNLPPIIAFMPHREYVVNTEKYALGPLAFAALASPVPADLVDFGASAEVVTGKYKTPSGDAVLTLIEYPTPQIATDRLRRWNAAHKTAQTQAGSSSVENAGPFFDKRSGPIIAIAAGSLSESDAKSLLGQVNYEANVTWNENTYFDKNNNMGTLLVNIIILCFVLGAIAIVAGIAFGGIRIVLKRLMPNRLFDRSEQLEFISLRLTEKAAEGRPDGRTEPVGKGVDGPSPLS